MNTAEVHAILLDKFGADAVGESISEAIDPWINVSADSLVEVATLLRDDERLQFNHLNDLCGVDYF